MRAVLHLPDNRSVPDQKTLRPVCAPDVETLTAALAQESTERRWAECTARIQSDAMQRAIDLLVREPDIAGFFRLFIQSIAEE